MSNGNEVSEAGVWRFVALLYGMLVAIATFTGIMDHGFDWHTVASVAGIAFVIFCVWVISTLDDTRG